MDKLCSPPSSLCTVTFNFLVVDVFKLVPSLIVPLASNFVPACDQLVSLCLLLVAQRVQEWDLRRRGGTPNHHVCRLDQKPRHMLPPIFPRLLRPFRLLPEFASLGLVLVSFGNGTVGRTSHFVRAQPGFISVPSKPECPIILSSIFTRCLTLPRSWSVTTLP